MSFDFGGPSGERSQTGSGSFEFPDSLPERSGTFADIDFADPADAAPSGPLPVGRPPWLYAGAWFAAAALGLLLGVSGALNRSFIVPFAGWVLTGPVAILLIGRYVSKDEIQRTRVSYSGPGWVRYLPLIMGLIALAGVVVTAYGVARWVATR